MATILDLPHELIVNIFCHLDLPSISKAGRVSKLWNEIQKIDFIWRSFFERHLDCNAKINHLSWQQNCKILTNWFNGKANFQDCKRDSFLANRTSFYPEINYKMKLPEWANTPEKLKCFLIDRGFSPEEELYKIELSDHYLICQASHQIDNYKYFAINLFNPSQIEIICDESSVYSKWGAKGQYVVFVSKTGKIKIYKESEQRLEIAYEMNTIGPPLSSPTVTFQFFYNWLMISKDDKLMIFNLINGKRIFTFKNEIFLRCRGLHTTLEKLFVVSERGESKLFPFKIYSIFDFKDSKMSPEFQSNLY